MNFARDTQAAMIVALLSAGSMAPFVTAQAAVSVQFDAGNVAFGYSDGYWDRSHQWHAWPNAAARNDWHAKNKTHYYTHAHTHDPAAGWRANDQWWGH